MNRLKTTPSNKNIEFWIIGGIGLLLIVIFIVLLQFTGETNTSSGGLAIGTNAPLFSLDSNQNKKITLDDYKDKPLLLYFNEGVGCQPCWQQIISLEQDPRFTNLALTLVTITPDQLSSWKPILDNNQIKSPILSDTDNAVSRSYGMLTMKSSMHGGVKPGHTFVLLDQDHTVQWIGDYPTMNASVDEIVQVVQEKLK